MATKTWNASSNGNANNAGNWSPSGVPAVGDDCVFDGTSPAECDFDIPSVKSITITTTFGGFVSFGTVATVTIIGGGLSVNNENKIKATSACILSFSGTPAYGTPANTNYVEYKCLNMFFDATSRNLMMFKFGGSVQQTITGGTYPHLAFDVGFRAQYNAPPTGGQKYEVRMRSILIGAGAVSQITAVPNADDRLMQFIIDSHQGFNGASSQFATTVGSPQNFDGGWGTWTFQAKSGGFLFPVTGANSYNGYRFKFRNVIIDSTSSGSGGFVNLSYGCILSLTNLTINTGAGLKGHETYGAIIHLVNRPTIYGTWGFYPIADGIYHYKGLYCLSVANGGTGIVEVNDGNVVLGYTTQKLKSDNSFNYNTSNDTLSLGNGGILLTAGTIGSPAANQLWVNAADSNKLYFGSSAVGSGGGGGGISGITVQDEGVALATLGTTFNFVDGVHPVATVPTAQPLSVQATGTGAVKTITIDGSKVRTNATDTLPAYLDAKIQQGANMSITLDVTGAASTGHAFNFAANNDKVKTSASDSTEDYLVNKLIAGTGITLTESASGSKTITVASSGGGGTGHQLFKHDQNPSTSNFNAHRLLVHNDTIEVGLATGSGKNVDFFSPAITSDGGNRMITIVGVGASATNTGREYIFYGQFGSRSNGDPVVYQFDNTGGTLSIPHYFIHHMSQVVLPPTAPNFSAIVTHQLLIAPMQELDSGFAPPNAVRVVDTGEWMLLNPALDEENPIPHRLFLVVDIPYDAIARQPTARLGKTFS